MKFLFGILPVPVALIALPVLDIDDYIYHE